MDRPIIKCDGLWHVYPGDVVGVKDLDLQIGRGEIVGVIGQNGSGKTTMVKHFNGLLKPTRGKVYIDGEDTAPQKVQTLSAKVGYVFQNPNQQLFARTVEEELEFGPRNLDLPEEEVLERREQAMDFFQLDKYRKEHPYRISFPLRKLVGMASVYTMQPDVFILDEPTTGQDAVTVKTVERLIRRLRAEGATILCVSHDMILLSKLIDRMVVLKDAEIIADASPREVFADRELMASTHLTPPQITELSLRLSEYQSDFDHVALTVDEMSELLSNGKR